MDAGEATMGGRGREAATTTTPSGRVEDETDRGTATTTATATATTTTGTMRRKHGGSRSDVRGGDAGASRRDGSGSATATALERTLSATSISSHSSPKISPRSSPRVSVRERFEDGNGGGVKHSPGERRLTYGPYALWFGALALGTLMPGANSKTREQWVEKTKWIDDIFVSPFGPAVPLMLTFARWFSASCIEGYDRERRGRVPLGTCARIGSDIRAYVFVALLRLAGYRTFNALWPSAFMSDHVFLGASVFTAIHGEVLCCAVDFLLLVERREKPLRRTAIMCVALFGLACMVFTSVEVFVTARFFHRGFETFVAAALGWFALQLPLVLSVAGPRAVEFAAALAL